MNRTTGHSFVRRTFAAFFMRCEVGNMVRNPITPVQIARALRAAKERH